MKKHSPRSPSPTSSTWSPKGPPTMQAGDAIYNRSAIEWDMGRHSAAVEDVDRAVAIWRKHVGDEHPPHHLGPSRPGDVCPPRWRRQPCHLIAGGSHRQTHQAARRRLDPSRRLSPQPLCDRQWSRRPSARLGCGANRPCATTKRPVRPRASATPNSSGTRRSAPASSGGPKRPKSSRAAP